MRTHYQQGNVIRNFLALTGSQSYLLFSKPTLTSQKGLQASNESHGFHRCRGCTGDEHGLRSIRSTAQEGVFTFPQQLESSCGNIRVARWEYHVPRPSVNIHRASAALANAHAAPKLWSCTPASLSNCTKWCPPGSLGKTWPGQRRPLLI